MIEAAAFLEPARERGFDFWAGVPCSFLTPFINAVIDTEGMSYVSAANEGDAVAIASGAALAATPGVASVHHLHLWEMAEGEMSVRSTSPCVSRSPP